MLLEDLKAQIASELGWSVRSRWLTLLMNRVYHPEEVSVYFAEGNQVLTRQLFRQVVKDFFTWDHLTSLPLTGSEAETFRSLEGRVLRLEVPLEQESEAS